MAANPSKCSHYNTHDNTTTRCLLRACTSNYVDALRIPLFTDTLRIMFFWVLLIFL